MGTRFSSCAQRAVAQHTHVLFFPLVRLSYHQNRYYGLVLLKKRRAEGERGRQTRTEMHPVISKAFPQGLSSSFAFMSFSSFASKKLTRRLYFSVVYYEFQCYYWLSLSPFSISLLNFHKKISSAA